MKNLIIISLLLLFSNVHAQKELNILPLKGQEMLHSYLIDQMYNDVHIRETNWIKALTNPLELNKYKEDIKARYIDLLGEFPELTPLNAKITGTINGNGYSIEKIIYESFPNHHVTSNLYIPSSKGKHPAVVFFCGHEDTSKSTESYQKTAILFVQNGFVVLVIDPISQSERHQFTNSVGKISHLGSTTEHTLLNESSLLLGKSTVVDILWDNKRGVDYLVTRSEIDTSKIGCLGNSGGGMQTLYYMAFDNRMKVAAPCSYFSIRHRAFEVNNPDDGCQQLPNEGKLRLDLVDYMTLFAPKPAIVLAGQYDFIYFQGSKDGANQVQNIYDLLESGDKFKFFVAKDGHGISAPKRKEVVEFFLKHLCNSSKKIVEPSNQPVQTQSALSCTNSGSIYLDFPNEITISKRNLQLYDKYKGSRTTFCNQDIKTIQKKIRILLAVSYNGKIEIEKTEKLFRKSYAIQKIIIHSENQTPLPCLLFIPEKPIEHSEIILFTDENGKNTASKTGGALDSLATSGHYVLAFDPRGIGETVDSEFQNDPKFFNKEYRNSVLALHNGKPLIGQRVTDICMVLDFISIEKILINMPVRFIAKGSIATAALHATFLDSRISKLELIDNINSWKHYLDYPLELNQLAQVIPGILKYYDLPDLVNLIKERVFILKK